jgi:hypothetical protein
MIVMNHTIRMVLFLAFVPAQIAAQRPDAFALRDSLATVDDVAVLLRLQAQTPMPGAARSPDEVVRRGLIALRIYDLTEDRADSERAREVFERGTDRFPDEAWMHYGLGLSYANAPEIRMTGLGGVLEGVTVGQSIAEILGRDPRTRARRAFARALEADPAFGAAAVKMAEMAVADGRDRDALLEARAALVGAEAAGGSRPEVSRALADVRSALGDYAGAEALLGDASSPDALHARAVSLLLQSGKAEAGAEAYLRGVSRLDEAAAPRYYRDIESIVQPAEEAEWRVTDLAAKRLWLERFWARRAAESGVTQAERLAEHYGRLALARNNYLRNSRRGIDGPGVLLAEASAENSPYDDRGIVLLRRGLPVQVVRTAQKGVLPNETWVYSDPGTGANQLFHFVALRGARDFVLVSDLLNALDTPEAQAGIDRTRAVLALIEDRATFEPQYQAAAARLRVVLQSREDVQSADLLRGTEVRSILERADADYRATARRALAEDVYFLRFDRPLPFHFDIFSFRTPFGRTDLTAAFAIPAEAVAATSVDDAYVYPLEISVILYDTLQGTVTRRDTTQRIRTDRLLGAGEFLRPHVVQPVIASEHTVYRVVVRNPLVDGGTIYAGGTRIRDLGGQGLLISDLVLAEPDSAGDWVRGDLRLALTLPRTFRPDRPFQLFYEVYNLAEGARYRTRLLVDPIDRGGLLGRVRGLFGGGPPRVDLRFEDTAEPDADGVIQEIRDMGTDLPPGRYRMHLTVTNLETGDTAETETTFEVTN